MNLTRVEEGLKKAIKNPEAPLYLGLDHNRSMDSEELRLLVKKILDVHGNPQNAVYIESNPIPEYERNRIMSDDFEEPKSLLSQSVFGGTLATAKNKRRIVLLDRPSFERLLFETGNESRTYGKGKSPETRRLAGMLESYITYGMREKYWKRILKQAKAGDLIIMHPNHVQRITQEIPKESRNVFFLHKPTNVDSAGSHVLPPLTAEEIETLEKEREKARKKRARSGHQ